ncbi:Glyoxylase, beta-lactamase superfamily II [Filimonas lacunae]|uniref:Glyoxylase, beta-lactamase superfamily II n=1 Tax=Filimonas lacunae TaxID=477680 RepID=A0A173MPB5_9BACT|nr:rhodanese-like domain-containing protein [Filimonas lacunae]BAV09208.1 metallo-beta-lactamase family protein [Filimonas lacunae]SIS68978.1 Glyoxylase, beta-lactamase superfamily II [Filimonas lacunae]
MYIEQLYTGCLSEAAYYIESEGEAAIIDPLRDIAPYVELATRRNATIKFIFETHFHADFVSGHIDLSQSTGAPIIYGPDAKARFDAVVAADGQKFTLGKLQIEVLHTPGHTLESACFLLKDENGKDYAVFTGDTLFVGDVGRPDLAQNGEDLTTHSLAGMLYDSLQKRIIPLADDVIVYPAHGAGSNCGKKLGAATQSTIGEEKQSNYALLAKTRDEFIAAVTEGLNTPPEYFAINARINKEGYQHLDEILAKALKPLSVAEFKAIAADKDATILDTRPGATFSEAFIPDSIFIGLEGRFAEWAGNLLSFDKPILLVSPEGQEKETVIRLTRVGFSLFEGYLEGGFDSWIKAGEPTDMIINIEPDELAMDLPFDDRLIVVDVRKEVEFADGHVKDAVNIPLANLTDPASMSAIQDDDNLYLHCASGYRSVIAASIMKKQGIHNLRNVLGGWKAIKEEEKIPTEKSAAALN